jgi:PAS domain S-box-containing protein
MRASGELAALRARLAEADETLRAIRSGQVDAVVVAEKRGARVFTLEGAEHAYRVLIESINEGALTLTMDKTILYANQRFAQLVRCPLEQVVGGSLRRFLSTEDRRALRSLMRKARTKGSNIQALLIAADGSRLPAQISIHALPKNGFSHPSISMVVTDLTEVRKSETLLRELSHRVVNAQESERGRVAGELHDHITQLLCAVGFRCQALTDTLSTDAGPSKHEAMRLRRMVGQVAEEVERISRNLRPGVLDELGLVAVLRTAAAEFAERTRVSLKLAYVALPARLSAGIELSLYRIFQEALRNVERHARARHVTVRLRQQGAFVRLVIKDDGVGFDAKGTTGLGMLGMHERARYVDGVLTVTSKRSGGTEVDVRIPVPAAATPRRRTAVPRTSRTPAPRRSIRS